MPQFEGKHDFNFRALYVMVSLLLILRRLGFRCHIQRFSMPNLPGPKIPFYAPFPPSKRAILDDAAAPLDRRFARVLCKDAIGLWLGFVPAPYRVSRFDDAGDPTTANNLGKLFAINEKVSANPFKFFLKPGTQIRGQKMDFSLGTSPAPADYPVKSISVWMPGHVSVQQVLFWINGGLRTYALANGSQSEALPTNMGGLTVTQSSANLELVYAVVTPNERKYNIRTPLVPDSRPMVVPARSQAPDPAP